MYKHALAWCAAAALVACAPTTETPTPAPALKPATAPMVSASVPVAAAKAAAPAAAAAAAAAPAAAPAPVVVTATKNPAYLAANCANCHGTTGKATGGMPSLAGLKADYIVEQMKAFKDGKRTASIMHQLSKGYTDEQISAIASYFASQSTK